ncbi:2OG-Fe dioxygenase family protein [Erwinia sp. BNK-24-b]|uniref:2OG-Fe dioxygenase family protein n=1 Tax=Erwinia TaxID=551 RepID=UPI001FEEA40D|nr:2OG-Fe dioxygenase family protein [Erwinia phyllosphaerae]MBV4365112.1 2OG-Fe dioxygenase family protein [Erwinia phyllosphaerae]
MEINHIVQDLQGTGHAKFNLQNFEDFIIQDEELKLLKSRFPEMPLDTYSEGNRLRNYIQVAYQNDTLRYGKFEPYQQTKRYNPVTGGVVRDYQNISEEILNTRLFNEIVQKDIDIVKNIDDMPPVEELMIGVHFFRYNAGKEPAYSSPSWLHKDDEDVVFMHLVDVSADLVGGESIIAKHPKKIDRVLRMRKTFDTLVVNHRCFHAVTPMSVPEEYDERNFLHRDIILVTFQKRKGEDFE